VATALDWTKGDEEMDKRILVIVAGLLLGMLLLTTATLADGGYDLPWSVLGGGGGSLGNGGITLDGTVGQPVVGQVSVSSYALCTGFWCGAAGEYRVYLPVVLREA